MNEQALVTRCQSGDQQAFGELYDAYIRKIYDFIYFRTHHKQTAEDLTNITFTKAWQNIKSFDPAKGSFSSWIYRIARNTVIDHYRAYKTIYDIENAWDLNDGVNLEVDLDTKLQLEKVKQYLDGLPAQQRDIVVMRLWDGLAYAEIGEILGKSEASCKMMFSRTIFKLKNQIYLVNLSLIFINLFF